MDPGLHAHRPAPCDKGLLLGYPPVDRIVGRTRWQTPAPKGADGPPSARTGLRLNGRLPGGTRPLGSRATAAHTPTGRTLAWRRQSKSLASLWLSLSISSGEKVFPRSLKGIKRREAGVRTDPRGACQRQLPLSKATPGWPAPPAPLQLSWERRLCRFRSTAAGVARESLCSRKRGSVTLLRKSTPASRPDSPRLEILFKATA